MPPVLLVTPCLRCFGTVETCSTELCDAINKRDGEGVRELNSTAVSLAPSPRTHVILSDTFRPRAVRRCEDVDDRSTATILPVELELLSVSFFVCG